MDDKLGTLLAKVAHHRRLILYCLMTRKFHLHFDSHHNLLTVYSLINASYPITPPPLLKMKKLKNNPPRSIIREHTVYVVGIPSGIGLRFPAFSLHSPCYSKAKCRRTWGQIFLILMAYYHTI